MLAGPKVLHADNFYAVFRHHVFIISNPVTRILLCFTLTMLEKVLKKVLARDSLYSNSGLGFPEFQTLLC